MNVVDKSMHRQELDGCDADAAEMIEHRGLRDAPECAT
jgi:hypothetical protein